MTEQQTRAFLAVCEAAGLPAPVCEHRFAADVVNPVTGRRRMWRFDFAWLGARVALEVEGGVWTRGRHTRASGFLVDMAKYNTAALLGWRVLRVTPKRLLAAETIDAVRAALQGPGAPAPRAGG